MRKADAYLACLLQAFDFFCELCNTILDLLLL